MSYILDALRRADSERERGGVPGVHAQPVPLGSARAQPTPPSRLWPRLSLALGTALVAALAWLLLGRDAAPEAAAEPPPVATPLPITPAVAAAVPVAPPPASGVPAPEVTRAPAVAPVAQAAANARKPVAAAPKVVAAAPVAAARTAAVAAAVSEPTAAPATARLPTANELPDDIQRGLPTLVVGGASYSQNAENRMLIVNGQVLREGDKVAPEVTLEQIRLKEAVLSTKGHRYRIAY